MCERIKLYAYSQADFERRYFLVALRFRWQTCIRHILTTLLDANLSVNSRHEMDFVAIMVILQWPSSGIQTEIDILSLVNIETSHSSSQSEILRHRPGHAPGSLFILVTLSVLLLHKIRRLIYVYFIAHFHYIGLINRCFQLLHFVCVLRVCILLRAFVVGNAESSYINNKNFLDFRCRADIQVFFNDNGKLLPIRTVTCKCL